ncbi:UNVERIFIED_CONTAM: hypothetical protein Cloal_2772 [Acetivibrio alkalicellulosi]
MKKLIILFFIIVIMSASVYVLFFMTLNRKLPKEHQVYGGKIENMATNDIATIDADDARNFLAIIQQRNRLAINPASSLYNLITLTDSEGNNLVEIYAKYYYDDEFYTNNTFHIRINNSQYIVDKEFYYYLYDIARKYNYNFEP